MKVDFADVYLHVKHARNSCEMHCHVLSSVPLFRQNLADCFHEGSLYIFENLKLKLFCLKTLLFAKPYLKF